MPPNRIVRLVETSPLRVLVADDDRDTADSTALLLRLHGHQALAVYDGKQAIDLARTFRPEVAVLDINMPLIDGYEVAALLRAEHPSKPHLVLIANTARAHRDDVERAREAGFDFHVAIGFAISAVLGVVLSAGIANSRFLGAGSCPP
jgi:CheY-like chemotaxis protein